MISILEGENSFLSKKRLDEILVGKKHKESVDIDIINAEEREASEIIQAYETQNIFTEHKVVVIKRLLSNKQYKDIVEKIYLDKDKLKNTDLIIWEGQKIPKNTRYYKLFSKENCIESFEKFNKRTFPKWAKEQLKKYDLDFEQTAFEKLLIVTNFDPNAFENEIEKFKILEIKKITIKEIDNYISSIQDFDIWDLIDAFNKKGNRKEIVDIIEKFLEKRIEPSYLLVMLARNMKQVILTNKLLQENKNSREIISILKIPPFTLSKIKDIAEKDDYDKFIDIYKKIYNLDYEIKSGSIDGYTGLLLLATKF